MRNVYFVNSDLSYHKYAVMCVNSIIKNTNTDVIWMQVDYIEPVIKNPRVKYINVNLNDYKHIYQGHNNNINRICKSIRFIELEQMILQQRYDNICLLDCDMIVVNQKFDNFFNLVNGSNIVVGVNENFKWVIDNNFTINDQPIFKQPTKLNNFICSVPLFFNCECMRDLVKTYLHVFLNGKMFFQNHLYDMGDMFAYNISMKLLNKDDNTMMFPAEMFTQTHMDGYLPWNLIKKDNGYFYTEQGLTVMSLHGRLIEQQYRDMIFNETIKILKQYNYNDTQIELFKTKLLKTIDMIKMEFEKYV